MDDAAARKLRRDVGWVNARRRRACSNGRRAVAEEEEQLLASLVDRRRVVRVRRPRGAAGSAQSIQVRKQGCVRRAALRAPP
jgi:hypothetical protein